MNGAQTTSARQRFMQQADARKRQLQRENPGPAKKETGTCMRCKRRTEITRQGSLVVRVVHDDTKLISCALPIDQPCDVCSVPGLIQCSDCGNRGHPACMRFCRVCSHIVCPDHHSPDDLCPACAISLEAQGIR